MVWGSLESGWRSSTTDRARQNPRRPLRWRKHPGHPRQAPTDTQPPTRGVLRPNCPPSWRKRSTVPIRACEYGLLKRGHNTPGKTSIPSHTRSWTRTNRCGPGHRTCWKRSWHAADHPHPRSRAGKTNHRRTSTTTHAVTLSGHCGLPLPSRTRTAARSPWNS